MLSQLKRRIQFVASLVVWITPGESILDDEKISRVTEGRSRGASRDTVRSLMRTLAPLARLIEDGGRVHGLGLGTHSDGGPVIEAYVQYEDEAKVVRATIAKLFDLDVHRVELVNSTGFHADVVAGDRGGHFPTGLNGTVGGFVQNTAGTEVYALSNNHVFANANAANLNDPLVSPTQFVQFGELAQFVFLHPAPQINLVDAAIGRLLPGQHLQSRFPHPQAVSIPKRRMRVEKYGASSGVTTGRITATNVAVVTTIPGLGMVCFDRAVRVVGDHGAFSQAGDSGSFVRSVASNKLVGLHFASDPTSSLACRIDVVLAELDLEIIDVQTYPVFIVNP